MKTLQEIVENAKDGSKPDHEECYCAMLVLSSLVAMEHAAVQELSGTHSRAKQQVTGRESHERYKKALVQSPAQYLGDNVPGNPQYDRMRKAGKAILGKIFEQCANRGP